MGMKHLWDTNTVIYFLQQQFLRSAEKYVDGILKVERPGISVITEIEPLCWKTATDEDVQILHHFI